MNYKVVVHEKKSDGKVNHNHEKHKGKLLAHVANDASKLLRKGPDTQYS